jgi:hypothetical protein
MPRNGQFLRDYVGRMLRKSCAHTYALFKRVRCEPDQFAVHVGHNHIASVPRLGDFPPRYAAVNPVAADNVASLSLGHGRSCMINMFVCCIASSECSRLLVTEHLSVRCIRLQGVVHTSDLGFRTMKAQHARSTASLN